MANGGDAKHFRHNSKAGWPYMSHRIFIQHGLNLWNVGMMASIGAWAIANGERRMWLLCLPAFLADYAYFCAVDMAELGGVAA